MRTTLKTALISTTLAVTAAVPALAASPAQAATGWYNTKIGSVSSWHCTAELDAHSAVSSADYYASGALQSHGVYQSGSSLWCRMEVETTTNGGRTWTDDQGPNWVTPVGSAWKSASTGWFNDNGSRKTRVCLDESYQAPEYPDGYDSSWRCTASW